MDLRKHQNALYLLENIKISCAQHLHEEESLFVRVYVNKSVLLSSRIRPSGLFPFNN
jgi:hypothetical protein